MVFRQRRSNSRFQFCKSDQHPGIALILTVLSQWHIRKYSGIKVNKPGEVVRIQLRVSFLFHFHQIWKTRFRRVWADDLVNIVCVICNECEALQWLYDVWTNGLKSLYTSQNSACPYLHWDIFWFCWAFDKAWQVAAFCLYAPHPPYLDLRWRHNIPVSLDIMCLVLVLYTVTPKPLQNK